MRYNNMNFSGLFAVLPMLFCVGNAFGLVDASLYPYYNVTTDVLDNANNNATGGFNGCVGKNVSNNSSCGSESSRLVFIAQNITKNGAEFCLNQVYMNDAGSKTCDNDYENWVLYFLPRDNESKCFWLCQPGYGGADCSESANGNFCYPEDISRAAFSNYDIDTSQNTAYTENESWLFRRDTGARDSCSDEREVFIAITNWLPSGHGAFVSPVIAYGSTGSKITISKLGNNKVLCAPGYKPNASNTDCEPVNSTTCTLAGMTFCSGFEKDKYNESVHSLKADSSGCYRYFCKSSNQAFPSALDKSCKDCAKPGRGGPSMTDGSCVVCPAGKYFDQNSNDCLDASAYSKSDMQFGKNSTKTKPIVEQCWNITEPLAYKKCVLSGGTSGSNSGNGSSGGGNNSGNSGSGGGTGSIGKYFQDRFRFNNEPVSKQEAMSSDALLMNAEIKNIK